MGVVGILGSTGIHIHGSDRRMVRIACAPRSQSIGTEHVEIHNPCSRLAGKLGVYARRISRSLVGGRACGTDVVAGDAQFRFAKADMYGKI